MDSPPTEAAAVADRASRVRRWQAAIVTGVYALLLGLALRHHEMWRDEIQAWLLARDAPSWWGVLHTIRYEGHPGLWHLLLWPVARLSWNPVWMQATHAAVASAAAWTFIRFAPFAWPVRLLFPFGYVLFYEWGVISRNCALSALLLFLFCAAFARRWRAFPWAAAALAAACHTTVHALLLVLVLTPLLMIDYAVAVAGRWREAQACKGRVVLAFVLVLFGIVTAVRQVWNTHRGRPAGCVSTACSRTWSVSLSTACCWPASACKSGAARSPFAWTGSGSSRMRRTPRSGFGRKACTKASPATLDSAGRKSALSSGMRNCAGSTTPDGTNGAATSSGTKRTTAACTDGG